MVEVTTYSEARAKLKHFMDVANDDSLPIIITRRKGGHAVLVSKDEWDGMLETLHLLRSPKNAERLYDALAQSEAGGGTLRSIIE
jgi:antitoxin YefM